MRGKLALFAVAAVVFAPGWGPPASISERPAGADIGRILAPTFTEANTAPKKTETGTYKRADREKPRDVSTERLAWLSLPSPRPPAGWPWGLVVIAAFLTARAAATTLRSPRAPPLTA